MTTSYLPRLVFIALLLPARLFGQAPQSPAVSTLHVNTRLVVIDVSVIDAAGNFVPGLDASQFTVYEDKVPQTIRSFNGPESQAMPSSPAGQAIVRSSADLGRIGSAPVNILVFDELNTPFADIAYARQSMERYLKKQPEFLPVPTLLLASGDTKFVVLHDYTQSRADLLDAIHHHLPEYASKRMRGTDSQGERIAQTLGVLEQIADSARGTPGRKNVIWIGTGYPSMDPASAPPADRKKIDAVLRTVTARMLAARMTLNTIDPEGVAPHDIAPVGMLDPSANQSPYVGNLDLETLAIASGGRTYFGRNDITNQIPPPLSYTLSYRPTNSNEADLSYRNIHVIMKDRSLRAVTRDGYFGGAAPVEQIAVKGEQAAQLEFDLLSCALSSLDYRGLHVEATQAPGGLRIAIAARDLTLAAEDDGSRRTEMTVIAVAFDTKNRVITQKARQIKESVKPGRQIDSSSRITIPFAFNAQPGVARVRIVVRDAATGNLGSTDIKQ